MQDARHERLVLNAFLCGAGLQTLQSRDESLIFTRLFLSNAASAAALNRTVVVPATVDLTGLGISQLACIGAGLSSDGSFPPVAAPERTIPPQAPLRDDLHVRFADAVERARGW